MQNKEKVKSTESQIAKISLIIYLLVALILGGLAVVNYTLVIGWIVGGAVSLIGFNINILFINSFFKKLKKDKARKGFGLGMQRVTFIGVYHSIMIILVILCNKAINGVPLLSGDRAAFFSPINVITYICGITIITISTLVAHALLYKGGKYVRKNNKQ